MVCTMILFGGERKGEERGRRRIRRNKRRWSRKRRRGGDVPDRADGRHTSNGVAGARETIGSGLAGNGWGTWVATVRGGGEEHLQGVATHDLDPRELAL
ncbi:hypothetical protein BHE74_00035989 [Ensete ventricosum]|nr:hypothetical protein BHE74_00035989 [Ensete ventricosum]